MFVIKIEKSSRCDGRLNRVTTRVTPTIPGLIGFAIRRSNCRMREKSRRDGALLTVCFSIRTDGISMMRSPCGTTLAAATGIWISSAVPAGLGRGVGYFVRMLKHTVNKVSSLQGLKQLLKSAINGFRICNPEERW
jgi:hypothetical protein